MKFIYVTDIDCKNDLISKGFHLITETKNINQPMWIFENQSSSCFDFSDKSKFALSNKMIF
jgi:hypothetical protein